MRAVAVMTALLACGCRAADVCEEVGADALRCSLATLDSARVNSTRPHDVKHIEIACGERSHIHEEWEMSAFKRFPGLETLSISHCKFGKINRGALQHLTSLKSFSFRSFQSQWLSAELKLEQGSFEGLERLEKLDISQNNIWALGSNILKELIFLKVLNVSGNNLQQLTELQNAGVNSNLQVLDVSNNGITVLHAPDVSFLHRMRELNLKSNKISVIHDGSLAGLDKLGVLDISRNKLVALPAMMLNETRSLKDLRLDNNGIQVLPPGLLSDLPQLLIVNMSSNRLSSQWIRKDTFANLFRLIVLDLSGNMLDTLSQDAFDDLSSLQVLDLGYNQLQTLPVGVFTSLSNLHTLTLSGNTLSRLERRALEGLHVLSRLSLDYNRLATIDEDAFANASSIQYLHFQRNGLTSIPDALRVLTSLEQLDLAENYISDDDGGVLKTLLQLRFLSLAGNKLSNVSAGFLSGQNALTMLDMSRNEIESLKSATFDTALSLRAIRLDANHLRNINGLFAKLPALRWLNVSDNQIEFFDYALIPAELRWLDMHKNRLREIGNFYNVESVIKLNTLDLSHNHVSLISRSSVPDGIKYLILANNQLTTVEPGTFEAKSQLIRADFSANQLTELSLEAVALPKDGGRQPPAAILLGGNPLLCSCATDWILSTDHLTAGNNVPEVLDGDRIMCRLLHSPNQLTPLQNVKPSDFLCTYDRHCFALCHCCNYVACDCEMRCPDGCSCYHDRTWNTNIVDCSKREQVTISREIPMDATAVFADGNNIHSLDSHTFIGRKRVQLLFVNGSNVEQIQNRSLNGLSSLRVLRLENNALATFRGFEFDGLYSLRELYLHNNRLRAIHPATFSRLQALEVLTLRDNRLTSFPVWQLTANPYLAQLSLANNRWSCACLPAARLNRFLADNRAKVEDVDAVRCSDAGGPTDCDADASTGAAPPAGRWTATPSALPLALLAAAALAVVALAGGLVFRYRRRLCSATATAARSASYTGALGVAVVTPRADKLYDVFVTYSAQDTRFVNEVLAPEMEQATPAYRLCLLRRDAPSTSYLGDAVHHCVQASRKTLLVLSRNFLDNEWCRFDFKASHLDALRTPRDVVVLLHGVSRGAAEGELETLLRGVPCVAYGEPDAWCKLRQLLSHPRGYKHSLLPHGLGQPPCVLRSCRGRPAALAAPLGDSPSPTCSTVMSDEESDGSAPLRLDPGRLLASSALPRAAGSCSSLQISEHSYMTIEHYQTAGRPSTEAELYSTLEPEVRPQMPSDPDHPGHHHQRSPSDADHPGHHHQRSPFDPDHPGHHHQRSPFDPDHPGHHHQRSPSDVDHPGHHHQRSLSHSLWV
ncbi:toll-like receptor 6 [Pollicipes pollicipes]|uniref:toll-like receptor 6 n=1 Tax=Pollicipes pollicipes TaxID=41117 RepID=UPI0018858F5F|nr:toll-like receptor 6 [Pollicipes pollicipes]